MTEPELPFVRRAHIGKPGIIGAQWWQDSVVYQVPRRTALKGLLALGGVLAAAAAIGTCVSHVAKAIPSNPTPTGPDPAVKFEARSALAMQKQYGWDFGAEDEALVFDGQSTKPFDRSALAHMPADLTPSEPRDQAFFVPTLFQSPAARPTAPNTGSEPFKPLDAALVPVSTAGMDVCFQQGQALAALFTANRKAHPLANIAVIVDLPGPDAVAFAAGAASVFDPVFLFDNSPHPRGVVPAHRTLGAAAYYQPLFLKEKAARAKGATPVFVLDRARLTSYTDEASQFDNRHVAKLPPALWLTNAGIKDLVYVGPNAMSRASFESDDVVDAFLAYASAKIALHVMPPSAFLPIGDQFFDAGTGDHYGYTGQPNTAPGQFWTDWNKAPATVGFNDVSLYVPTPRTTTYSTGRPAIDARPPAPPNFGYIPVAIAVGTGAILGARMARNGSWNRTTYTGTSSS